MEILMDKNISPLEGVISKSSSELVVQANSTPVSSGHEWIREGFVALDHGGRCTYVTHQAELLLGLHKDDLLGKAIWEVYSEAIATLTYHKYQEATLTRQPVAFEEFDPSRQQWFAVHIYPSPEGFSLYFTVITERKRTEADVRASEQIAQAVLNSLSANIAVLDKDGTIITKNEAWTRFARENSDHNNHVERTSVGVNYLEVCRNSRGAFAEEALPALTGIGAVLQGTASHFILEYPCHSPTKQRWFLMNVTPLPQQQGAVVSHLDITERRQAEEALKRSEARLRRLVDSNLIGLIFWDIYGHITDANDAFLHMIGYTREELLAGKIRWTDLTPAEYEEVDRKALEELRIIGVVNPLEKAYIRKDGSRIPILIHGVFLDESRQEGVSFVLDITERKELEERKDNFISMASHELKTPITTLKGYAQLLKRKLEQQGMQDLADIPSRMDKQINRLTALIEDLLDVSKIRAGRLDYAEETIDLDALVRESVETIQQTTTTHTIAIHGASHQKVQGDRDRLGQVLTNLISNAIKYSPQADTVDIHIAATRDTVTMRVQDYGIGIPKDHQAKIFDRFYRVHDTHDKTFPGLGIGLYITYEIVKRHGGEITVVSEEGKGSTFCVSLPLVQE
jgi:PAS domain S-box-containing protein